MNPLLRRTLAVLAVAAASTTGASCGDVADAVFTPPRARLAGVAVGALGTAGPTLDVALVLENPNPYTLTATGARYRLMVNDTTEVGSGATTEDVTVGARDSITVRLPVTLGWSALGGAGQALLGGTDVDVMVVGEVMVDTPLGDRTVPLRARSRVKGLR